MAKIEVEDVPEDTYASLRDLAATQHQSLEEFVLETLAEVASMSPPDPEFFERHWAEMRRLHGDRPPSRITTAEIVDIIREGRESR